MRVLLLTVCLQLIVTCVLCESNWWMDQPYNNSRDFNTLAEYTHNVMLKCEDHDRFGDSDFEVEYWIRPDLTIMKAGDEKHFNTLDGTAGWQVTADMKMNITLVQDEHFGFYHCVGSNASSGATYVIKKGLNYKGAHFGDLWEMYRKNVIIGCSAAGAFLFACIVIYIVHCCFFNNGNGDDDYEDKDRDNLNMVVADEEAIPKKGDNLRDMDNANDANYANNAMFTKDDAITQL